MSFLRKSVSLDYMGQLCKLENLRQKKKVEALFPHFFNQVCASEQTTSLSGILFPLLGSMGGEIVDSWFASNSNLLYWT
jgi:hypothetical protein